MQGYPPRLLALCERCPQAMLNREYWSIKDFVLVKEVGSGAASNVYYAICRKSTQQVAIKMYLKSKLSKLNRRQVEREINIHSSLNHPNIIDFYAAFEDDDRIYLVQEYAAGGDLFDDVKRRGGRLPEREVVQNVLFPYLNALSYLHARGIIHRDIKPENTVFTRDRVLKLTDFGLAINARMERPVTRLGTLDYMAPEVLRCPDKHSPEDNKDRVDLEYDASVDAWAMGVLAYELIVGRPPFGMSCREATMRAIVAANPPIPEWMSPLAADFIRAALQRTPARRYPVPQLLRHPWIASNLGAPRSIQVSAPAQNLPCGAEAAAVVAVTAAASSGTAAAAGAPTSPSSSKSLFYHPGGPYRHLLASPQSCTSASGSELGGSRADGLGSGVAITAAMAYGSDQRPAKRQVQRCQSASLNDGGSGGAAATATAAVVQPGQLPQQGTAHAHMYRLCGNMSYWMTDGNGFSRDPLVGLGDSSSVQQQQLLLPQSQQQQSAALAAAAEAVRWVPVTGVIASPLSSPMALGRAQDFYQSQVARAFADAAAATGAGSGGVLCGPNFAFQQEQQQQQQLQQLPQQQQLQLSYNQLQLNHPQQQMVNLVQQQQQMQQQQFVLLQQQQQQMVLMAAEAQQRQRQQMDGDSVSGSGENTAASGASAAEPVVPPRTAADYYRLHLEDARTQGSGCRTSPGPRGLSRSFTVRHAPRTISSAGGVPAAPAAAAAATAAAGAQVPTAAARLLRNVSSSSGGSMKRRTPDTHDWDLPQLPTALSAHQLHLQYIPGGRTGGGGSAMLAGDAAVYYTGAGGEAAAAAAAAAAIGCVVTPFSPYAAMPVSAAVPPGSGGVNGGQSQLPSRPQLGSAQSLTSFGSSGGRTSRLAKAFRRVESIEPAEAGSGGFSSGPGGQVSDGSGCGGGGGSGPLPAALPPAQCSAAAAAAAALDQLTLAARINATAAVAVDGVMTYLGDDGCAAGAAAAMCPAVSTGGRFVATGAAPGNTHSESSNGSSAAASTAVTAVSLGGTSGPYSASACSYGYSAASGSSILTVGGSAAAASSAHRTPSPTTCGALSSAAAQNMAALRLSLPTSLPRLGIPAVGSITGSSSGATFAPAAGLRSHPLSSPQITPWSTPLSSPAAGRMPRVHSQPQGASSSFNALLELMEADGVLMPAEGTAGGGTSASVSGAGTLGGGGGDLGGSLDMLVWTGHADSTGGGGRADGRTMMQMDETGGGASPFFCHMTSALDQECAAAGVADMQLIISGSAVPSMPATTQMQHVPPEDRWTAAWAAAAAAGGGGGSRTTPTAPMTPPSLGRSGSIGFPGSTVAGGSSAGGGCAVHTPSPLGRDQRYHQARAAAMQQHIRSRSLNRFQLEQMGLPSVSSSGEGGGGGAVMAAVGMPSPFALSPPISPRGPAGDSTVAVMGPEGPVTSASFTSGGSSGTVSGGSGAFGNRLVQQTPASLASLPRGPSFNPAVQMMAAVWSPYTYSVMGAVQRGGNAVTSPSPLGLRSSRSRASNGSSDDTNNNPPSYMGGTTTSRPSDASYGQPPSQ